MRTSKIIPQKLNQVLSYQLTSINQYFLHARILKNWGIELLGGQAHKRSISAMKEADGLIERLLFLGALPNLQVIGKLNIGQTVEEILGSDLRLEMTLQGNLTEAISSCEKDSDFVSRDLLLGILEESESRIDYLENQIELIGQVGLQNYIQSASEGPHNK